MKTVPGQGTKEEGRVRCDWVWHQTAGEPNLAGGGWVGDAFGKDKGSWIVQDFVG